MLRPLYIFDLDGTLADCTHRTPLLPDYDAYYAACDKDAPIRAGRELYRTLWRSGADLAIWTGRRADTERITREWFTDHGFPLQFVEFRMRQVGDRRHDVVVKREWLQSLAPADRERIVCVFEDRTRCVAMWREEGVACYQVATGDF